MAGGSRCLWWLVGLAAAFWPLGLVTGKPGRAGGLGEAAGLLQVQRPTGPRTGRRRYPVDVRLHRAEGVGKGLVLLWVQRLRAVGADGVAEQMVPVPPRKKGQSAAAAPVRLGPFGQLQVRAVVDPMGLLHIGTHVFGPRDMARLRAFIDQLHRQGVPVPDPNAPLWGLSDDQFQRLQTILQPPSKFDLRRVPLDRFARLLHERTGLAVKLSESVSGKATDIALQAQTGQLSLGAATAYVLATQGLAFEPRMDAAGNLSLLILGRRESKRPWPIGLKPDRMPGQVAPQLFQFVQFRTTDTPLTEVVASLSRNLRMDVLLDVVEMSRRGLDPEQMRSSVEVRRTSWASAIRKLLKPLGLKYELRIDEANRPWLWITVADRPLVPAKGRR